MSNAELAAVIVERDVALAQLAAIREQIAVGGFLDFDRVSWTEHEPPYGILVRAPEAAAVYRQHIITQTANRADEISESALLLHTIGAPGAGPFTAGQRYADEARLQIAEQIRKAFGTPTTAKELF